MNRSRSFWTLGVISDIAMLVVGTLILMFNGQDIKFTILEYSIVITVVYRFLTRCARYSLRKEGFRLIKCTVLENQGNRRVKYVYNANDLKDNKLKNRVDTSSILVMTRYEKLKPGENVDVLMSSDGEKTERVANQAYDGCGLGSSDCFDSVNFWVFRKLFSLNLIK